MGSVDELETLPLFEHSYDEGRSAMSRPLLCDGGEPLPNKCVMSFMGDALERFVEQEACMAIANYHSEVRDFPIYGAELDGQRICLVQGPVGAPAAALLADLLIASGVTHLVSCGGCGVLEPIESGRILVPRSAVRDEGTSYHYLAPSREVMLDPGAVASVRATLGHLGLRHETCKVWTCDAFFRETPRITALRREQGCSAVDMECSALAAVAHAYGAVYAALFYSGDTLADPDKHDERGWIHDHNSRDVTLRAAVQAMREL